MEEIINHLDEKMNKTLDLLREDLASVRTGRATPALLENVKVEAYGSVMRLRDLASMNVPEPRLLVVNPWDVNLTENITKAVRDANLGLNPVGEPGVIRVPIPPLTEERRRDFLKVVGLVAEKARISIRQIRREALEELDKREEEGEISEDDNKRLQEKAQKMVGERTTQVAELAKNKEKEILLV